MESVDAEDLFTQGPDGKPSKVTDYKLRFPADFEPAEATNLDFTTDENYAMPTFHVAGGIETDIKNLRNLRINQKQSEHGILLVRDGKSFYKTRSLLAGESGIGFRVTPRMPIADYLHTHNIREGEDEKRVDLFSAFDLWKMGTSGAERFWLVGANDTWVLINLYGQRYYHYIKDACMKLAGKESAKNSFAESLAELTQSVNACNYRLYRSEDSKSYCLVG